MHGTPVDYCGPATPRSPFESHGLGYSEFARHYYRNHGCFLFLGVLRWFTSPGLPRHPMDSDDDSACSHAVGFPIRKSPDHSLLAATRSLSQLVTSFIACLRQGIHTHALSSLTIKSTSHPGQTPELRTPPGHRCTLLSSRLLVRRKPSPVPIVGWVGPRFRHSNARQYSIVKDRFLKKSGG